MRHTLSIFALLICFFSCSQSTQSQQVKDEKQIKHISVPELNEFAKVDNTIFLDVRTPEEFNSGAISGALHINYYADNFKERISQLDKTKNYIVYCKSGMRSEAASQIMKELKFQNIYNLTGGYDAYKQ